MLSARQDITGSLSAQDVFQDKAAACKQGGDLGRIYWLSALHAPQDRQPPAVLGIVARHLHVRARAKIKILTPSRDGALHWVHGGLPGVDCTVTTCVVPNMLCADPRTCSKHRRWQPQVA